VLRWIDEHQALPARLACVGLGHLWVILSSLVMTPAALEVGDIVRALSFRKRRSSAMQSWSPDFQQL